MNKALDSIVRENLAPLIRDGRLVNQGCAQQPHRLSQNGHVVFSHESGDERSQRAVLRDYLEMKPYQRDITRVLHGEVGGYLVCFIFLSHQILF